MYLAIFVAEQPIVGVEIIGWLLVSMRDDDGDDDG